MKATSRGFLLFFWALSIKVLRMKIFSNTSLTQCWCNASPLSATLAQHQTSTGSMSSVCWVAFNSTWSDSAYCWQLVQADTDPMSVKCWASVAGADQYPFSPSQYFILAGLRAHTPMPFKCWPASYTMARHRTNAHYTDTLPAIPIIDQYNVLNQSWVNVGQPSVMLAHIQRGAKYTTLSQH